MATGLSLFNHIMHTSAQQHYEWYENLVRSSMTRKDRRVDSKIGPRPVLESEEQVDASRYSSSSENVVLEKTIKKTKNTTNQAEERAWLREWLKEERPTVEERENFFRDMSLTSLPTKGLRQSRGEVEATGESSMSHWKKDSVQQSLRSKLSSTQDPPIRVLSQADAGPRDETPASKTIPDNDVIEDDIANTRYIRASLFFASNASFANLTSVNDKFQLPHRENEITNAIHDYPPTRLPEAFSGLDEVHRFIFRILTLSNWQATSGIPLARSHPLDIRRFVERWRLSAIDLVAVMRRRFGGSSPHDIGAAIEDLFSYIIFYEICRIRCDEVRRLDAKERIKRWYRHSREVSSAPSEQGTSSEHEATDEESRPRQRMSLLKRFKQQHMSLLRNVSKRFKESTTNLLGEMLIGRSKTVLPVQRRNDSQSDNIENLSNLSQKRTRRWQNHRLSWDPLRSRDKSRIDLPFCDQNT